MSKLEDALLINSSASGACLLLPVQAMQRQIRIPGAAGHSDRAYVFRGVGMQGMRGRADTDVIHYIVSLVKVS